MAIKVFSSESHCTYHFLLNQLDFQQGLFFMVRGVWPLTGTEGQVKRPWAVRPQLQSRHHSVDSPCSSQVQDKQGLQLMLSQSVSSILLCLKVTLYNSDPSLRFSATELGRMRGQQGSPLLLPWAFCWVWVGIQEGCCGFMYIKHVLHIHYLKVKRLSWILGVLPAHFYWTSPLLL